jgi:hypothetical protein
MSRALVIALVMSSMAHIAQAQSQIAVEVHVSPNACSVRDVETACDKVGIRLRGMGVPLDADIHVIAGFDAKYQILDEAMKSLRGAGYKLRTGVVSK